MSILFEAPNIPPHRNYIAKISYMQLKGSIGSLPQVHHGLMKIGQLGGDLTSFYNIISMGEKISSKLQTIDSQIVGTRYNCTQVITEERQGLGFFPFA